MPFVADNVFQPAAVETESKELNRSRVPDASHLDFEMWGGCLSGAGLAIEAHTNLWPIQASSLEWGSSGDRRPIRL
jgi:hypothetical protein